MQTIVLIPALRPGDHMVPLIRELAKRGMSIVVVDDGSGEEWRTIFQAAEQDATVLTHQHNAGKGSALKTGLVYIHKHYSAPYVVVTADADGQHRVNDIYAVAQAVAAEPNALVLGSRALDGSHVPVRSKVGNAAIRYAFQLATGTAVHDTQTGLRGFGSGAVPWMSDIAGTRFEYEMNVLLSWVNAGHPVREVTIETVYLNANHDSHFNTLRDSARIMGMTISHTANTLGRFVLSSFSSFILDYLLFCLLATILSNSLATALALGIANMGARIVSATLNYRLNRSFVFCRSKPSNTTHMALRYTLLAMAILLGNTALLQVAVSVGIPALPAKALVEVTMAIISFTVQRTLVFSRRNDAVITQQAYTHSA